MCGPARWSVVRIIETTLNKITAFEAGSPRTVVGSKCLTRNEVG
jgi:hypothetical protein